MMKKLNKNVKKNFTFHLSWIWNTYYNFKLTSPKKNLSVFIKQTDDVGTVLTATQEGDKKEFYFKQLINKFF